MAVDPKEKRAFDEMFDNADAAGSDIPDGTYQFEVMGAEFAWEAKKDGSKGRPQFHVELKVVGGDEEYIGKIIKTRDNLETEENIGWFKKKLQRLNLRAEGAEVRDGTLAQQIIGKTFEGQAKTKNDFLNIYVNRLLSEGDGSAAKTAKKSAKEEPAEKAEKEEKEETEKVEGFKLPSAEDVEGMKMGKVKEALGELGFDADEVESPRLVLHGFCTLAEDETAKIELEEMAPLAAALGIKTTKGDIKGAMKALSAAVQKKLG